MVKEFNPETIIPRSKKEDLPYLDRVIVDYIEMDDYTRQAIMRRLLEKGVLVIGRKLEIEVAEDYK